MTTPASKRFKRKATSLGTVRSCLRYAILYDGARFTIERTAAGMYRRACERTFATDAEARAAAPEAGVEWRSISVRGVWPAPICAQIEGGREPPSALSRAAPEGRMAPPVP